MASVRSVRLQVAAFVTRLSPPYATVAMKRMGGSAGEHEKGCAVLIIHRSVAVLLRLMIMVWGVLS